MFYVHGFFSPFLLVKKIETSVSPKKRKKKIQTFQIMLYKKPSTCVFSLSCRTKITLELI